MKIINTNCKNQKKISELKASMKYLLFVFLLLIAHCSLLISCSRNNSNDSIIVTEALSFARPMAILQTGRQPLWFQLTERGPINIETIEEAIYSAALIPWPLALHISFAEKREFVSPDLSISDAAYAADSRVSGEIVMTVNRYGFLTLVTDDKTDGFALYRFSAADYWQHYTVGGFVYYDEKPAAALYLDTRFLEPDAPLPRYRTWSFNMESNTPFPITIPAIEIFPADEGWSVDTLRRSSTDNLYYYRLINQSDLPQSRILRTSDLSSVITEEISISTFYESAPRETTFSHSALPPLPEGFLYTKIIQIGENLFAAWEEQEEFFVGAAGFVAVKVNR